VPVTFLCGRLVEREKEMEKEKEMERKGEKRRNREKEREGGRDRERWGLGIEDEDSVCRAI
jgi:hypothetical protein